MQFLPESFHFSTRRNKEERKVFQLYRILLFVVMSQLEKSYLIWRMLFLLQLARLSKQNSFNNNSTVLFPLLFIFHDALRFAVSKKGKEVEEASFVCFVSKELLQESFNRTFSIHFSEIYDINVAKEKV